MGVPIKSSLNVVQVGSTADGIPVYLDRNASKADHIVLVNRVNVFVVGYRPPISEANYAPAFSEILITVGLIAGLMFLYRFLVTYLPVLSGPKQEVSA